MIKYLLLPLLFSTVSGMDQAKPYTKPSRIIRAKVRMKIYVHPKCKSGPVDLKRVKNITPRQLEEAGWVIIKKNKF